MREEKNLLLEEVKENIESSPAFLMTQYQGMDPNTAYELRKAVSGAGGFLSVVKKSVFLKAAQEAGMTIGKEQLEGHVGIIYTGEDTVATTKAVFSFKKGNKDTLTVLGGHFEGKLCTANEVEAISELPTKDEMRAQFLGLLEAPASHLVGVMESLLSSPLSCLENKIQKDS